MTSPSTRAAPHRSLARGFTLVELVIVILVIAILTSLAVACVTSLTKQAKINSTLVEARKYQQAAMIFLNRNGRWPNDVSDGIYPPEFVGYIPNDTFLEGPGMGGVWDWNGIESTLPHYGIAVRAI